MSVGHSVNKRRDDEEESESLPPPDGGWGWMVVFGSFMIHVITDGVTYSFGIFYDEFLDYFKEGKSITSWILSILVGVTLCSGPLSSYFVNRWGCRAVTILGSVLAAVCLVASFWANSVLTLCLTIGVGAGTGFGMIYLPAIVSVTTYFEKKRSLATGIAVCGSGFGTFIFAPIIARLLTEYGWRGSILIIGGIVLECILFGALFRPLEEGAHRERASDEKKLKNAEAKIDIHVSEHDLPLLNDTPKQNGGGGSNNNNMHRPHSVSHFSLPSQQRGRLQSSHNGLAAVPSDASGGGGRRQHNEAARLALSQPMLVTQSEGGGQGGRPVLRYGSQSLRPRHHHHHHGPIDRPDAFYQGSLMNIPSYRSRLNLRKGEDGPFLERRHSTFSHKRRHHNTSDGTDLDEDDSDVPHKVCGVFPCSDEVREMLDFSLFRDVVFLLFSMSNLLTSIGFNVPYVYLVSKGTGLGMTKERAGMLISIIGGANTIGRIMLGYISDKPWINRLHVYNWSLTVCGAATLISAFLDSFYSLAVYSTVFGFTAGAYVGLTSVILVDLLGIEKLTNAFGLLLLFQGIASLVGPPLAGSLYDWTGSYDPGFALAGVAICLSGLILFAIPPVQRWQARQEQTKENVRI